MKQILAAILSMLLSGSAIADGFMPTPLPPAGKYADGEAWLVGEGLDVMGGRAIPNAIRRDLAACAWQQAQHVMLKMDIDDLNSFARGEFAMSPQTKGDLLKVLQPISQADFSQLQPYCPDKIPEFQAAVK